MGHFEKILFPVDFSPSNSAMVPFVKRAADIFGAQVTLVHVFDLPSYSGFELYVRPLPEVVPEHQAMARDKLDSFLRREFPLADHPRVLLSGDPATQITDFARKGNFELIIMPTHAGLFRRTLLGSTTAKILNDADCPVLTTQHAEVLVPRLLEHREWLCAIGLSVDSERVLRYASEAAATARARLSLIHAIPSSGAGQAIRLELEGDQHSGQTYSARRRVDDLQKAVGSKAQVHIAIGPVKDALLEAVRRSNADILVLGRSPQPGALGRMRDLTYAMIRDSPFPVVSV